MKVVIELPDDLVGEVTALTQERNVKFHQVVELYLRSMVNSSAKGRTLGLQSSMPFGKYKGAPVETIIRAAPDYIRFLIGTDRPVHFDDEALALLVTIEQVAE